MTTTSTRTNILSIAVFWALAGVSAPSVFLNAGVAVVEAFAGVHPPPVRRPTTFKHRIVSTTEWTVRQSMFQSILPEHRSLQHASTTSTRLESAKILPFVYTGLSTGLFLKAGAAPVLSDRFLLLAFLSYGRLDNAKLKSAKLACKKTLAIDAQTGKEEASSEAQAWRKAVRLKIILRVVGMLRLASAKTSRGVMRGAAFVLASSLLFLAAGGEGEMYHDADGNWKPKPENEESAKKIKTLAALFIGTVLASLRGTPLSLPLVLAGVTTAAIVEREDVYE